jgi:catechol 2,3-dioxygenase-like lactoylglutathione lyase family enzyme
MMMKKVVPMIHVPDVRATVAWYESIGFKVVVTYGDETGDNFSFAIVSFGETEVMFNTDGEPSDKRRREVDLYVYTDNVDELYESLKARVEVIEGPHDTFYGMRELIIRDLNRFWITFGQESVFAMLMGGIYEGDVARVRKALESRAVMNDTLNVAFAFASGTEKRSEQILEMLTAAGAQPPPAIDLATLESYTGSYKGEHGLAAEITLKDGRLFAAPRGQQPMSLWPLDQVTFRPVAISGATIIFEVADGKTVGMTFVQDGHRMKLSHG